MGRSNSFCIAITGFGGDIAQAVYRSLIDGLDASARFVACDIKPYVAYQTKLQAYYQIPRFDEEGWWQAVALICDENPCTHFLPITEGEIKLCKENRTFFAQRGIELLIHNDSMLEIAFGKYSTYEFLSKGGIKVPETWLASELPHDLQYPLIVKPNHGRGSVGVFRVDNEKELREALANGRDLVVQRYIGNAEEEYTLGVFFDGEETRVLPMRRSLGRGGMSTLVETVLDPRMTQLAQRCSMLFDSVGCYNIQLRKHENDYYVFEINPRISSTVGFRHQFGFRDAAWWVWHAAQEGIEPNPNIESGRIGIKVDSDFVFDVKPETINLTIDCL